MGLLDRNWLAEPGASDEAVRKLVESAPVPLPEAYLALLKLTNGGEGPLARQPLYIILDKAETVADNANTRYLEEFFPGFFEIGSNGAGECIALDVRTTGGAFPVVALDRTNSNLDESLLPIAPDFASFLELLGVEPPE